MEAWIYRRRGPTGRVNVGTVMAPTYETAYDLARAERYSVIELTSTKTFFGWLTHMLNSAVDNDRRLRMARINFWKLLRLHIRNGNEKQALISYIPHCRSPRLLTALEGILIAMEKDGKTLTDAMELYPTVFDPTAITLLRNAINTKTTNGAIGAILDDELLQRRLTRSTFLDRLDSYVTYVVTLISLFTIAKTVVPSTVSQATDAKVQHNLWIIALQALGVLGDLLTNPIFYVLVVLFIIAARTAIDATGQSYTVERWFEGLRWKVKFLRDADLAKDRLKALKVLDDSHFAGLGDQASLENTIPAVSSLRFKESLQASLLDFKAGDVTLTEALANNPLWGDEITSYFASHKGGSWHEDVQDMIRTSAEEQEQNQRLAAFTGTGLHALLALAVTFVLTIVVTVAQFVLIIAQARQN